MVRTLAPDRRILRINRPTFLRDVWNYEAGEHVTILGKTGSGKTHLGFQLLQQSISKDLPGIVLVMKPRDDTVSKWMKTLGLLRVKTWPPPMTRKMQHPAGYVLWPQLGNIDQDDAVLRREFRKAFKESFSQAARKNGEPRAIFVDEVTGVAKDLKLENELNILWGRGRSVGIGMWGATQRPFNAPLLMYQAAEHLFIPAEPDQRNRQRLGEIGGFDMELVKNIVDPSTGNLGRHEFLYLGQTESVMAVVTA